MSRYFLSHGWAKLRENTAAIVAYERRCRSCREVNPKPHPLSNSRSDCGECGAIDTVRKVPVRD